MRSPIYYLIQNAENQEEVKKIKAKEVDNFYNENGSSTLAPYEMCERMYLVVKAILNKGGKHEDYVLQKGDIIKLGRAKFLVRDINLATKHEKIQNKNELEEKIIETAVTYLAVGVDLKKTNIHKRFCFCSISLVRNILDM